MKLNRQCNRVLAALEFGAISQKDATDKYGITRLAARIKDLRDAGYYIETEMREVTNRFGEKTRVAFYSFQKKGQLELF